MRWNDVILRVLGVAALFAIVGGLYLGQAFLVPLALSILLTFILSPAVGLLQKTGLSRIPSVVIAVAFAFGVLAASGYFVVGQVRGLAGKIPEYRENIQSKLRALNVPVSKTIETVQGAVDEMKRGTEKPPKAEPEDSREGPKPVKVEVVDKGLDIVSIVAGILGPVVSLAGSSAVVVLLVLFFLVYQNDVRDRLIRLAGGENRITAATQTLGDAVHGVSRFLFTQALLNVTYGVMFGLGLFALGVPNALLWGFTATVLRFVPYLGPVVAGILPVLLSIALFPGWGRPAMVGAFIVALELVSNNLVEPWAYGKRTGLSPLAVVLAAIFWAWLWGPVGLLLSVPLTVCLITVGKHVPGLGFFAVALGDEPPLGPELQVFHRLLMGNLADAAELLEKETEGKPLAQAYDDVLVPIVRLANEAAYQGRIEDARMDSVVQAISETADDLADAARVKQGEERTAGGLPRRPARAASVLCLAGSDRADELTGNMLARLLSVDGFQAERVPLERMTGEKVDRVESGKHDIVMISVLPPSNLAKVRYLYKRLRRRYPGIPVVIGVWGLAGDSKALEKQLAPDGRAVFAATLGQAHQAAQELAQTLSLRRGEDSRPAA